jgi:hypothetical protein
MKYRYRSIDRYRFDTLPILVFLSNADTEPILNIASGATIGIDSETDINNPTRVSMYYMSGIAIVLVTTFLPSR